MMLNGADREIRVRRVVAQLTKRHEAESLQPDVDVFRQLGIESSSALELLLSLEDEFGVQVPDVEFGEARTLRQITALMVRLAP